MTPPTGTGRSQAPSMYCTEWFASDTESTTNRRVTVFEVPLSVRLPTFAVPFRCTPGANAHSPSGIGVVVAGAAAVTAGTAVVPALGAATVAATGPPGAPDVPPQAATARAISGMARTGVARMGFLRRSLAPCTP